MSIRAALPSSGTGELQLPVALVGDDRLVPCLQGERKYLPLDAAASTAALPEVAERIAEFLPWYSSVHRGAGYKSQVSTRCYEDAREEALAFAGRDPDRDVAIICRNTTEAINMLAYRLGLAPNDVVVTTVVEHHANMLPWGRVARRRFVDCSPDGRFATGDVIAALDEEPRPRLLAITGASNVTGWLPPLDEIIDAAHERDVPVFVDAAQLAPHRPLSSSADYVAWSGHKMYAPFGSGVLIGPRATFERDDPFIHGGGAVDIVELDDVVWTDPPEREEAGSPNVVGAVALHEAMQTLASIGWAQIEKHEAALGSRLKLGLSRIPGVRLLGPPPGVPSLAVASFVVEGVHHGLAAARLSVEFGIGVRHGCFCAHPYVTRLLGLDCNAVRSLRESVRRGDRRSIPGAVRASAGISTALQDIEDFLSAVRSIASGEPAPIRYLQDPTSGDFRPEGDPWNIEPEWPRACKA